MSTWHVTIELPPVLRGRRIGDEVQSDLDAKKLGQFLNVIEVSTIPGAIQWKAGRIVRLLSAVGDDDALRCYVVVQTMKLTAGPDHFLCPIVFLAAANATGPYVYWTFSNFSELERRERGLAKRYERELKRIGEKFFQTSPATQDELLAFSHIAGAIHAVVVEKHGWLTLELQHFLE